VRTKMLEQGLAEDANTRKDTARALEELGKDLAEESEARTDLEKALGKDLREYVSLELDRMRDTVMREMRERMDGQKVLREEVQLQQGSLMRLTSRVEESLVELRTEVPRLSQENLSQSADIAKTSELLASSIVRIDCLDKGLVLEARTRKESEGSLAVELREYCAKGLKRADEQFEDLQHALAEERSRLTTSRVELEQVRVDLEQERVERKSALENSTKLWSSAHEENSLKFADFETMVALWQDGLQESLARLTAELKTSEEQSDRRLCDGMETLRKQLQDLAGKTADQFGGLQKQCADSDTTFRGALEETEQILREELVQSSGQARAAQDEQGQQLCSIDDTVAGLLETARKAAETTSNGFLSARQDGRQYVDNSIEPLLVRLQAEQEKSSQQFTSQEKAMVTLDVKLQSWTCEKTSELEMSLKSWVDSTAVTRINSLDGTVHKEMAERSSSNQQILDKITHNSERWCQLQSKFDEILLQVHKGGVLADGRMLQGSPRGIGHGGGA